jgi:hypothetical protein
LQCGNQRSRSPPLNRNRKCNPAVRHVTSARLDAWLKPSHLPLNRFAHLLCGKPLGQANEVTLPLQLSDTGAGKTATFELPVISDPRGSLTFLESGKHFPFSIERVYYLYDIPSRAARGGHAHKALQQVLIALSGSFDVVIDNGAEKKTCTLSHPSSGLYIGPLVWRELENFSSNAVCLVLASMHYSEDDYFRNYSDFIERIKG